MALTLLYLSTRTPSQGVSFEKAAYKINTYDLNMSTYIF